MQLWGTVQGPIWDNGAAAKHCLLGPKPTPTAEKVSRDEGSLQWECPGSVTPVVEAMDGGAVRGESWSGAVEGEGVHWRGVLWLTWSSPDSAPALPRAPLPCSSLALPYASSMVSELSQGSAPCPSPSMNN